MREVGGGGERRTMRIAARHADIWNTFGSPQSMRRKVATLHRYCADVGRDPSAITPTVALMLDRDAGAERIAALFANYRRVGVRGIVIDLPAPYDLALLEDVRRSRAQ